MPNELVIGDETDVVTPLENGLELGRGLVPRSIERQPPGYLAGIPAFGAVNMPLIPRSEWSARIKLQEQSKTRLSDIRNRANGGKPFPSLNQGPVGYCWAHGPAHAEMLLRAAQNQPYIPLSAYAAASIIKRGRDEGGWGALALEWMTANGIPSQKVWPQGSRDLRLDTSEMRADAATRKVIDGWVDLQASVYDRDLTFDQVATCLLQNVPVVGDFMWWGHCVCCMDLVETSPGNFGVRILNSWGDEWGDNGVAVLSGSKAVPDNAVAPRVVMASFARTNTQSPTVAA